MRGRLASWVTDSWLDAVPPTSARDACRYGAAMAEDPFATDPLAAEAGGMIYARPRIDWTRVDAMLRNSGNLVFKLSAGTRIVALGFFTGAINAEFAGCLYLPAPVSIGTQGSWTVPSLSAYLSVDVV